MYEHVLVALDGSEAAEHVLPHVEALASAFHSRVTLVRAMMSAETLLAQSVSTGAPGVGEMTPPVDPTPIIDAERKAASDYLSTIEQRLSAGGLSVTSEELEGDAAPTIVKRAAELGVGLIMMTTHGRGGLGRVVFGSVADSVLRHAPCAVLLVRVTDSEAR